MADRIQGLGVTVLKVPSADEIQTLVPKIARLWAELHEADPALAAELLRKLPKMEIRRP